MYLGAGDYVIIKSTAGSTIRFLWRDYAYRFPDATQAGQFLAKYKSDPVAMAALRRLLSERDWLHTPVHMNDDEVLKAVAALLGSGELVAGVEWKPRVTAPVVPEAAAASAGGGSREPAAEEPESNTFGSDHDPAAQAAALIAAAESGVPFCEECARAAAAQGGAQ